MPPWSRMCVSARVSRSRVVTRADRGDEQLEGAPDEEAGGAHAGELLGRLALAAVTVEQPHAAEPYRRPPLPPHPRPPVESREHAVSDAVRGVFSTSTARAGIT